MQLMCQRSTAVLFTVCYTYHALQLLTLHNTICNPVERVTILTRCITHFAHCFCVSTMLHTQQTKQLPGTGLDDAGQLDRFGKYEFSDAQTHFKLTLPQTVATLNGAHTVGKARVTPKSPTNVGIGAMSSDPNNFNGIYYTQVMSVDGYKGL
eukprot:14425-Heterococcus_DN1.PRE.5